MKIYNQILKKRNQNVQLKKKELRDRLLELEKNVRSTK